MLLGAAKLLAASAANDPAFLSQGTYTTTKPVDEMTVHTYLCLLETVFYFAPLTI